MLIKITNYVEGTPLKPGVVLDVPNLHPSRAPELHCSRSGRTPIPCPTHTLVVVHDAPLCPVHDYTTL